VLEIDIRVGVVGQECLFVLVIVFMVVIRMLLEANFICFCPVTVSKPGK
jgi:hypothetical protein